MAFDAKAVANYLLDLAQRDGQTLSPMRVIKLVYIAHGWHLALLNKPLIDEYAEAWQFGPVIPSLYHEFKRFGNSPIDVPASRLDSRSGRLVSYEFPTSPTAKPSALLIDRVWDVYKRFSAGQLSAMTHKSGTPWDVTWNDRGGKDVRGTNIPTDLIKEHYRKMSEPAQ